MNDTPETIQAIRRASVKTSVHGHMDTDCVYAKDMAAMERERDQLRQEAEELRGCLQTVRDEVFGSAPIESAMQNIAAIVSGIDDLRKEYWAMRDALRVRIEQAEYDIPCMACGFLNRNAETCRHYETEKKVMK